jgi:hypothetical protein
MNPTTAQKATAVPEQFGPFGFNYSLSKGNQASVLPAVVQKFDTFVR